MSVDSIRQQIAEAVDEVSIVRDRGDNRRYSERIAGALIAAGFIRETDNTGSKLICAPGHYDGDGCTFPTEGHLISVLESEVLEHLSRLSSSAINRVIAAGEKITEARFEDGVFE